jgi:undecaprenyl-diphosphatase
VVLVATAFLAWLGAKAVKGRVRRGRPADFFEHAVLRERATDYGYVSGHTMVAVAVAVACGPAVPAWGELALLGAALLVGTGRLYVGAHLPLDVVGGAGLGVAAGAVGAVALDTLT